MKKTLLIALTVALVLAAGSCAIDPSLDNALENTVWKHSIVIAGSKLIFNDDGTGSAPTMVTGTWEDGEEFTYTYDPETRTGIIDGYILLILAASNFDGDMYEFTVAESGDSLSFRGWEYSLSF